MAKKSPARLINQNLPLVEQSMHEVLRMLGPDVLVRWYRDLPARYGG